MSKIMKGKRCLAAMTAMMLFGGMPMGVGAEGIPDTNAEKASAQMAVEPELSTVLISGGMNGFDQYRIPAMVIMDDGTIVVAYESRRGPGGDFAEIYLTVRRSTDGGKTFGEPVYPDHLITDATLERGKDVITWHNPVLIADGETLHLIFCKDYHRAFYCYSEDGGLSFSVPVEITDVLHDLIPSWTDIATGPGHGLLASDGRLIVPFWVTVMNISMVGCIYSDDHGATWKPGFVANGKGRVTLGEPIVVELLDGRFLLNCRNAYDTKGRSMCIVDSTLSSVEEVWCEESLKDPSCMGSTIAWGDDLYFVNCASDKFRVDLTLYKSSDQGKTWEKLLLIDEKGGYADIAVDETGIYIFYESFGPGVWNAQLILKKYAF